MRQMTITEGLAELKLLGNRIEKATQKEFVWSAKKVDMTETENAKYKEIATANYASVTDLIENRRKIKSAIVKSNANTMVKVGTKEMTVAEAIERKTSIAYERMLLTELKRQFAGAKNNADNRNVRVQEHIDNMLSQIAASNRPDLEEAQKVMSETYMANNGWGVFDPLNLEEIINTLETEVDEFEKNVDIALSMSNAVTFIEV